MAGITSDVMVNVDHVEVGRIAHELEARFGTQAHLHAAKMAAEALTEGKADECEFWRVVEQSVMPR
jgi:hypothetical protein